MNRLKIWSIMMLIALLTGCNSKAEKENTGLNSNSELSSNVDSLEAVVKTMRINLDGNNNSPEELCANIDELFKANKDKELKEIATKLRTFHPESPELKKVEEYIYKIEQNYLKEQEQIKAERMKVVDVLNKDYDDINGITWYKSKVVNHDVWSNKASLYIGKNKSQVWLRMLMSYYGSNWIFFEYAYLSYDGNTIEIPFDRYRDKKTENSGGMVWEWIDIKVESNILSYLKKFVKGDKPKMRLSGKYTETRNLSANEIKAMKEILLAYDVLKNE